MLFIYYGGVAQLGEHLLCTQGVRFESPHLHFLSREFLWVLITKGLSASLSSQKREEGVSPYAAKQELLDALRTMQKA